MSAKVDGSLVQDGYHLYHHTFVLDEVVELLRAGIDSAHVKRREKLGAIKRLQRYVPQIPDERL